MGLAKTFMRDKSKADKYLRNNSNKTRKVKNDKLVLVALSMTYF